MRKYKNKPIKVAGVRFDSKGEHECYSTLKLLEKAGQIKVEQVQETIYLTDARIQYRADFRCLDLSTNTQYWVEYKGFETPSWRIKRKLWIYYGPGKLEIWKSNSKGPFLFETLEPK